MSYDIRDKIDDVILIDKRGLNLHTCSYKSFVEPTAVEGDYKGSKLRPSVRDAYKNLNNFSATNLVGSYSLRTSII